jgi:hypothetical protein
MYRIAISRMSETDRNRFYSLNFSSKDYAQSWSKRIEKSVKTWNRHTKKWHYLIICENCQLHEIEKEHASLKRMYHAKRVVIVSLYMSAICVVQESTSIKIFVVLINQLALEKTKDSKELSTTSFTSINKTILKKDVHVKSSSSTFLLQRFSSVSLLKEFLSEFLSAFFLLVEWSHLNKNIETIDWEIVSNSSLDFTTSSLAHHRKEQTTIAKQK